MTCEVCNGTNVSMIPKHMCSRHGDTYFECLFIVGMGDRYQREGNYQQAIERYLDALGKSPTHVQAWFQITLLYQRRHDYVSSLYYVNRWLKISPTDNTAWAFKGVALCGLGQYDEAITCFEHSKGFYIPIEQTDVFYAYSLQMVGRHSDALNFCNNIEKQYKYYDDIKKIKKQCRKHLGLTSWWKFWCP